MGLVKYSHMSWIHTPRAWSHINSSLKKNKKKVLLQVELLQVHNHVSILTCWHTKQVYIQITCTYYLHIYFFVFYPKINFKESNPLNNIPFHAFSSTGYFYFYFFGLNLCVNLGPNDVILVISLFGCVYIYILYMLDCVLVYTIVSS